MRETVVMLFHGRGAAEQFCDQLKDRGFNSNDFTIIGPEDLPQYGRGEHAVAEAPATGGGLMDKLASFFGMSETEAGTYADLSGYLEAKGLSHEEANYYQNEVRNGSTMLVVRAGDRIAIIDELSEGSFDRGTSAGAGYREPGIDRAAPSTIDRGRDIDVGESDRMRLYEEEPVIERGETKVGEAQISKDVVTEHETIDVPKRREDLVVERHPIEGRGDLAENVNLEDTGEETIRVPLMEEEVSVEKRPVAKEDVEIGKREVQETEREPMTLRHEELDVDENRNIDIQERRDRDRPAA